MFSEHFYPCDRNEDRKSVQWMFLPQLPETGKSWNIRGMFLAQLLETRKSWNIRGTFLA